nr:hypothetical protein [Candidatus Sigynarchaeota archaeon]
MNYKNEWSIETTDGRRIGSILKIEGVNVIEFYILRNSHDIVFALKLNRSERNLIYFFCPQDNMQNNADSLNRVGYLMRLSRFYKHGYTFHLPSSVSFGEIKESFIAQKVRICRLEREIALITKTMGSIIADMDPQLGSRDCILVLGIAISITIIFPMQDAKTSDPYVPYVCFSTMTKKGSLLGQKKENEIRIDVERN